MTIYSLEEYKEMAEQALKDTGAFLRVSRDEGLFVTDAKRRGADVNALKKRLPGFSFSEKEGLVYLTPNYGFSSEANSACTMILKSDADKRERLIRTHLAAAMRSKNKEEIALFERFFERMINT
ncbi:MAG: hypothetical protein IKJ65_06935 [Clostridia bacterium]|nr:hypothetical protein [Clostridia bacterium]